ncbi:MAG: DMT family transporter [Oligoflexia bacterium]|nr:DMT family transporter [Oligoflexia bacterium]
MGAAFSFGFMGYLVHALSGKVPSGDASAQRSLFIVVVLLPWVVKDFRNPKEFLHFPLWARAIAGAFGILAHFWTLQHASVATARALTYLNPVFTAVLGTIFLKEWLKIREWAAISLVVLSATVPSLIAPETIPRSVVIVGALGAFLGSVAYTSLRRAASQVSATTIVWLLSLLNVLVAWGSPMSSIGGTFTLTEPLLSLGIAIFGLSGQMFLTLSHISLKASVVATLSLSSVVWGMAFDAAFGRELPTTLEFSGVVGIMFGVLLLQLSQVKSKSVEPEVIS